MQLEISKTDYYNLMLLIDKVCQTAQSGKASTKEYNAARRLKIIKKKIERRNKH